MTTTTVYRLAELDSEQVGDIRDAPGTIAVDEAAPRRGIPATLRLLAIIGLGPDHDGRRRCRRRVRRRRAGRPDYGTSLLWTLLPLVPVL